MEESTSTFLYTATYVFVFIIATSLSIGLYFTINRYADSAFNYSQNLNSSVINTSTTGTEESNFGRVYLSREDVFSYYVNYTKKDIYGKDSLNNKEIVYNFEYYADNVPPKKIILDDKLSYSRLYEILQGKDKFYLVYKDKGLNQGKQDITIQIVAID